MPHEPPAAFSRCVLQCLETIAADTAGTNVIADTFNQQERQLTLYGPESPDVFQSVLRTVIYTNLAPDINVAWIRVEVFDGINSTTQVVQVLQGVTEMRKRRDVHMIEPDRRHSHPLYVTENESEKPNKEKAVKNQFSRPLLAFRCSSSKLYRYSAGDCGSLGGATQAAAKQLGLNKHTHNKL